MASVPTVVKMCSNNRLFPLLPHIPKMTLFPTMELPIVATITMVQTVAAYSNNYSGS
jgi:hypothetical protein